MCIIFSLNILKAYDIVQSIIGCLLFKMATSDGRRAHLEKYYLPRFNRIRFIKSFTIAIDLKFIEPNFIYLVVNQIIEFFVWNIKNRVETEEEEEGRKKKKKSFVYYRKYTFQNRSVTFKLMKWLLNLLHHRSQAI